MKKTPLLTCLSLPLFLIASLFTGCAPQPGVGGFDEYDPLIRSAMLAYTDGDYETALAFFQDAFEIIPDDSENDLFHAAAAALQIGRDEVAEQLIRDAIVRTNPNTGYFRTFEGFEPFRSKELFSRIDEDYEQLVRDYYDNLPYPQEIDREIVEMRKMDQAVRSDNDLDKMAVVDSANINRLMEITATHGWIEGAWLILWHQRGTYGDSNAVWNHFRPLIDREIAEGKVRRSFWAQYDDEKMISEEKKQLYGMYQDQFPVVDVAGVDERRAAIGLPPLWYLARVYGFRLPGGYVAPEGKPGT